MSGHTHIHTHRTTTVTLAAHARRGLTSTVTLAPARRGLIKSLRGPTLCTCRGACVGGRVCIITGYLVLH